MQLSFSANSHESGANVSRGFGDKTGWSEKDGLIGAEEAYHGFVDRKAGW